MIALDSSIRSRSRGRRVGSMIEQRTATGALPVLFGEIAHIRPKATPVRKNLIFVKPNYKFMGNKWLILVTGVRFLQVIP
ncbi:hypothetical protein OEG84_20190 [Hoeflea sp. G2-23]|uniref:Transposase n=1 Tax=Hoeflea algicola TaxID=2983763 RepID=A0ABT3ZE83_9HYPH|nr:hypothetical protein [Hoeflea algicola]MCY0149956.1 hypothetical protein [Hoeflea algicola]